MPGTSAGTAVQLFDCNGTSAQNWTTRADGSILHPASGLCLDDVNGSQAAGDRLQLYGCNGTAAQRFKLS